MSQSKTWSRKISQ